MKYSPRTFENFKMSSLHFLSYIVIISGVTRGLNHGGKLREKGHTGQCTRLTTQHSEKHLRNDGESGYGCFSKSPPENNPKNAKKQPTEN